MLKSTHRPAHAHTKEPPLPPGWTEHKAPSGHSYYYNSETKQSTYTRPSNISSTPTISPRTEYVSSGAASWQGAPFSESHSSMGVYQNNHPPNPSKARSYFSRRSGMEDRPKSKQTIPGCEPWLLVRTKLGRRFVYNPDLNESFWKFPMDVMKAVIELDKHERDRREGKIKTGVTATEYEKSASNSDRVGNGLPNKDQRSELSEEEGRPESDNASEEYEEIEVTDEEVESEDEEMTSKRQKFEDGPNLDQPVEFNEDDIAYQLEAMGQDYGLDPGEYGLEGDGEWEQGAEGLPLTEEDSAALFKDMLEDYGVNPYSTWDKLTENERIVEDERYTVLPNTKTRKEIWTEWSRLKIQELKEAKEKMEKKDPRIPYIAFLQKYATPKLYWPEFKRKYKKEPEMRDSKFSDKEREKLYREHISRLKLPDSTKKDDLSALLKAQPLIILNRSTSIDTLPATVLSDIRFISLPASTRDPLIDAYVSTISGAPSPASIDPNDSAEVGKKRIERQNREKALANRQKMVEAEKRRQNAALRYGKGLLREEEAEIERAMRVDKSGLRGQIEAP